MVRLRAYALAGFGLVAIGLTWTSELGRAGTLNGDGPFIIVSRPWGLSAPEIVDLAGADVVGPVQAPLSVLAAGATPQDFETAGAWAVLSPDSLPFLCAVETSK